MHEHFDVLIVGAGLSGIGAGYHLQKNCPGKSYAILEARDCMGGTWDLFRYPGIRSDSDMYTLGYSFRPWRDAKAIADGPSILKYVRDTAKDYGVDRKIRFQHRVKRASWSTPEAMWTVEVERGPARETARFTCNFLFMCSGYYRYDEGYSPQFPGIERFAGRIVHPQKWTDDVDYAGKRVVVIGSGATAVTLVPELAKSAAHVTMLQRSPTWIISLPQEDRIANFLRRRLPAQVAYGVTRWKNVLLGMMFFRLCKRHPELAKKMILRGVRRELGPDYDVATHFTPRYNPWDQRLCLVPNSDLFAAINAGSASVVTDQIETFTEKGLRLRSGRELDADLVVTATGLNLLVLGGLQITVDGQSVDLAKIADLQGHDVQRRTEPRLGVRLYERVLDAEVRSHLRVRVPPAESHGRTSAAPVHASSQRSLHQRGTLDRFLLRLRATVDRKFSEAGIEGAVATAPELCARHHGAEVRRCRG